MYKEDVIEVYNRIMNKKRKKFDTRQELIYTMCDKLGCSRSRELRTSFIRKCIKGLPTNKVEKEEFELEVQTVQKVEKKTKLYNKNIGGYEKVKEQLTDEMIKRIRNNVESEKYELSKVTGWIS